MPEHDATVTAAFTEQAEAFNSSPVQNSSAILDAIVGLAAPRSSDAWLDAACGPGIVTRAFAPHVASILGVDLTPAMIELARIEAVRVGAGNATFAVGDATALSLADDAVDGAVTRYSLHHVPAPGRMLAELARVVRPGGQVVIVDHLADAERDAFAWAAEVERLRDPSHWASLTPEAIRTLGAAAGLRLTGERSLALTLDLDEWLHRGTSDATAHRLVAELLRQRPTGTERFAVDGPTLTLQIWLGAFAV